MIKYIMYWYTCMSKIGMAEKYRGVLHILQCKKKYRRISINMYDQIYYTVENYEYLEDTIDKSL